jgi:orotidine-5'-phosphate decarboxylase
MHHKVICALDTQNLDEAIRVVKNLAPEVGSFKVGHALTLNHGLEVVSRLQDAGAQRIFLDLKFHDIPNSVALAVREAASRGVWMMTMHASGGPAMMTAAFEESQAVSAEIRPILLGVTVLTSLNQHDLTDHLGIQRDLKSHMLHMSRLAVECGLDGVVCSPDEVSAIHSEIPRAILVVPGIRKSGGGVDDHSRAGSAMDALNSGASYLVIGRGLMDAADPKAALADYGLLATS